MQRFTSVSSPARPPAPRTRARAPAPPAAPSGRDRGVVAARPARGRPRPPRPASGRGRGRRVRRRLRGRAMPRAHRKYAHVGERQTHHDGLQKSHASSSFKRKLASPDTMPLQPARRPRAAARRPHPLPARSPRSPARARCTRAPRPQHRIERRPFCAKRGEAAALELAAAYAKAPPTSAAASRLRDGASRQASASAAMRTPPISIAARLCARQRDVQPDADHQVRRGRPPRCAARPGYRRLCGRPTRVVRPLEAARGRPRSARASARRRRRRPRDSRPGSRHRRGEGPAERQRQARRRTARQPAAAAGGRGPRMLQLRRADVIAPPAAAARAPSRRVLVESDLEEHVETVNPAANASAQAPRMRSASSSSTRRRAAERRSAPTASIATPACAQLSRPAASTARRVQLARQPRAGVRPAVRQQPQQRARI